MKNKDHKIMIGSGEYSIFMGAKKGQKVMLDDGTIVKVGITLDDHREEIEYEMDRAIYGKPVALVKKLVRKINKTK